MPISNVAIAMNQITQKRKYLSEISCRATETAIGQYR
jgi:hypothetical protein